MGQLPPSIAAILTPFATLFSRRVWAHAQVLLAGALLAPAQRTVAAALRAVGLAQTAQFHRYHRVLSHARWSGLALGARSWRSWSPPSRRTARSTSVSTRRWSAAGASASPRRGGVSADMQEVHRRV